MMSAQELISTPSWYTQALEITGDYIQQPIVLVTGAVLILASSLLAVGFLCKCTRRSKNRLPGYLCNQARLQQDQGTSLPTSQLTTLLEQDCHLHLTDTPSPSAKTTRVHLQVTSAYLKYAILDNQSATIIVDWSHVIGCQCLPVVGKAVSSNGTGACFCVYAYAPIRGRDGKIVLHSCNLTFEMKEGATAEDNLENAKSCQSIVLSCIQQANGNCPQTQKPYLVFLTPCSGQGESVNIFNNKVAPVFRAADIPFETILTERANHALEIMKTLDISGYSGVLVVAGDGVVYEVLNGLFSRRDWRTALSQLPLGCIAAGSGNGLASSIAYANGLSIDQLVDHSILATVLPSIEPMDLLGIELSTGKRIVSFESISHGIIADVDIESERLRMFGPFRFTLGALALIIAKRSYPVTISYLPIEAITNEDRIAAKHTRGNETFKFRYCPPLSEPVPSNWVTLECCSWASLLFCLQTHVASNFRFVEATKLNDGILKMAVVHGDVTRLQLIQIMQYAQSTDDLHKMPAHNRVLEAAAVRLTPHPPLSGVITVDGETVPLGPLQAEVLPGFARIMTPKMGFRLGRQGEMTGDAATN